MTIPEQPPADDAVPAPVPNPDIRVWQDIPQQMPYYPTPETGAPGWGQPYPAGFGGYMPGFPVLGGPIDPTDPLVTMVGQGFSGWFQRLRAVLARGWRQMLGLIAIGWLTISAAAIGVVLVVTYGLISTDSPGAGVAIGIIASVIVVALAAIYLQAVVTVSIVWTVTKQANGEPARIRSALGFGFRRALPVIGWQLLVGLLTVAGLCACIVPGLYVLVATSMIVPIIVFERGVNPISGSFALSKRFFGAVLGRFAVLYAPIFALQIIAQVVQFTTLVGSAPTSDGAPPANPIGFGIGFNILFGVVFVVQLVWQALTVAGSVLTYAEMRGRIWPTTTAILAAELERR